MHGELTCPLGQTSPLAAGLLLFEVNGQATTAVPMLLQVSGEVQLACSWRITPADVAHIQVKARQAELDRKQEVLALLLERYPAFPGQSRETHPTGNSHPRSAADFGSSTGRHSIADAKRIQNLRGHMTIKVNHTHGRQPGSVLDHLLALFNDQTCICSTRSVLGRTCRCLKRRLCTDSTAGLHIALTAFMQLQAASAAANHSASCIKLLGALAI